jgi:REP element-mobilizing transposase RayT
MVSTALCRVVPDSMPPVGLHPVRARGSARQRLFQADADREDSVQRLAKLAEAKALTVYAWALVPNHFHLLVRTGRHPLVWSLRSLLTGSAGAFNRRSRRSGQVLQNRYQSVVCDEAVYLLELVRSLHLHPVRARSVAALEGVAKCAYSGHGALEPIRITVEQAADKHAGNGLRPYPGLRLRKRYVSSLK